MERLAPFALQHATTCARCRVYGASQAAQSGTSVVETNRSAIWGGATLGLIVGLLPGFFRENYCQTVLYAVLIDGGLGVGAEVIARAGNSLLRRR